MKGNEELAYDIGAFGGDSIDAIKSLGYDKIVCFEPHSDAFFRLNRDHHNPPHIVTENLAVSSQSGKKLTMYSSPDYPWVNTVEEDWIKLDRHANLNHINKVEVDTITLDDYIVRTGEVPAYIKIDAEGHELEILKGLHYPPRMISFEWISERLDNSIKCLEHIAGLGLDCFKICFGEKLPEFEEDEFYSYEECICRLRALNDLDREIEFFDNKTPKLWGDIWCK